MAGAVRGGSKHRVARSPHASPDTLTLLSSHAPHALPLNPSSLTHHTGPVVAIAVAGVAAGAVAVGGELEREREGEAETWPTSPRVPRALTCAGGPLAACQAAGRRPRPLESIAR